MSRSFKNIARLLDSVNEKISPEQDFLCDLKRSIELTDMKNARKPSMTYKPSSMKCIRSMYYQVSGAEIDKSNTSYCLVGICNSGTDIHVRVQTAVEDMKNNNIDCEYIDVADFVRTKKLDYLEIKDRNTSGTETKLYHKDLNMSFMCDGIIKYKGKFYILELKTENSFKWTSRKDVADEHHSQATAYSIAFKLNEVLFVYINRDNLDMKAFIYKPTDEEKMELLGKISECDNYAKDKITPPKPNDISKTHCSYCSYKTMCDKEK